MKRIILSLAFLIGFYHISTSAFESKNVPKVGPILKKVSQEEMLKKDLFRVLSKTKRLDKFEMAKVNIH